MDFKILKTILPKKSESWRADDVEKWLRFIHLEPYILNFRALAIDGSNLKKLSESDLREQLQINSRIILKKLSAWLPKGLDQFDNYLTFSSLTEEDTSEEEAREGEAQTQVQQYKEVSTDFCKAPSLIKRHKQQCLILRKMESSEVTSYYKLVEMSSRIGRHANCEIQMEDENVDAYHCKVIFRYPHFYLKNISMIIGTYIKVSSRVQIANSMVAQMGSHIFSFSLKSDNKLKIKIVQGESSKEKFVYSPQKLKVVIGRKSTCDINIGTDTHLSNMHSKISFQQGAWHIQDMGTTNGTWVLQNEEIRISNGMIFKLGNSNMNFECELKTNNTEEEQTALKNRIREARELCSVCKEGERNMMFIPCNHVTQCQSCGLRSEKCDICLSVIREKVKIFCV